MVLCLVLDVPGSQGPDELGCLEGDDTEGSRAVPGRKIEGTGEKFNQDHDGSLQLFVSWKMELTSI